jgi:hypothetical protein
MTGPANGPPSGKPPLAVGDMSPGGSTTVVRINKPRLDYADKKVLCSAMCQCQTQPNIGKNGRSLKQECVSSRLKALDTALGHTSPYKAEYTYDMTKRPPEPFLDKVIETKGRDLWPGWTKTLWPKDPTRPQPYKAGRGYTRRPDVVIVKDPARPPTQDNIRQVVEMKFPGDTYGAGQLVDYRLIAGDQQKLVPLELWDCDCNKTEPEKSKIPVEQLGPAAAILGIIYTAVTKRPPPGGVPAY